MMGGVAEAPFDAEKFEAMALERISEIDDGAVPEAMAVVFNVIRLANRMVQDLEAEVHRSMGWSWAGFRIMFALWVAGPLEPRAIAHLSAVTRASVSSVLNTLERDGLVERRRESADRRIVTVTLTSKGRRQVASAYRQQNEREQAWVQGLSAPDRRRLAELLSELLRRPPAPTK